MMISLKLFDRFVRPIQAIFAWDVMLDTGKTVYELNRITNKRRVWQRPGGYQPIDSGWVETGRWTPPSSLPSGNSRPNSTVDACLCAERERVLIDRYLRKLGVKFDVGSQVRRRYDLARQYDVAALSIMDGELVALVWRNGSSSKKEVFFAEDLELA